MTTKERITEEALTLFSMNGYNGTSMKQIADAVGIKDSSIYKHFKSKQEILDTIIKTMEAHMDAMTLANGLPVGDAYEQAAANYAKMDEAAFVALSKTVFLFYLKDTYISRFWRLAQMEQYRDFNVYALFNNLFYENSLRYQSELFKEMMKQNIFKKADPDAAAMNFYAPIFFLLSKYSAQPEKEEEALLMLDKQIREFCRIYKK